MSSHAMNDEQVGGAWARLMADDERKKPSLLELLLILWHVSISAPRAHGHAFGPIHSSSCTHNDIPLDNDGDAIPHS